MQQSSALVRRLLGSVLVLLATLALTAAALPTAPSETSAPAPAAPAAFGWGVDQSPAGDATVRTDRPLVICAGIGSHPAIVPAPPAPVAPAVCSHAPVRGTIGQRTGESTAVPGRAPPAGDQPTT
ncbi:hypothetical protein ACQPWY_23420 [Pseudonocardia xinjiangensis]|uniref:hypothetical protein n=1 Tax=Pseudonocardia xinjiangensis TaxID=75289 RepID=UPI003D91654B